MPKPSIRNDGRAGRKNGPKTALRRPESPAPAVVDGIRLPPGLPRRRVDELRAADRNPRLHSPAQVAALAGSIREYGFLVPVVVDAADQLVAGHARLAAAAQLGLSVVPWIDATHLTPAQRRGYLIADNQLTIAATWDDEMLGALLRQLEADNADLLGTLGFTPEELAELLAAVEQASPAEFPAYDETVPTSYQCPQCGFEWSGQPKPKRADDEPLQ